MYQVECVVTLARHARCALYLNDSLPLRRPTRCRGPHGKGLMVKIRLPDPSTPPFMPCGGFWGQGQLAKARPEHPPYTMFRGVKVAGSNSVAVLAPPGVTRVHMPNYFLLSECKIMLYFHQCVCHVLSRSFGDETRD